MKIDLHTHILPETWPDLAERYGYPGFVRLVHHAPCRAKMMIGDQCFREIEDDCWNPTRRLEDCAKTGVAVQVLSTVPVMFSYWAKPADALDLSRLLNDHIAGVVAQQPTRFFGLGTIPMQDPDLAIRELERCVRELHMPGVQIGTHVEGVNLGEPRLFPIFEAAEKLGAAVFVHPWDMLAKPRMEKYWLRWLVGMPTETCLAICSMIFAGVFERLPRLRVCFAHGGGSFPGTIGRIQHGFEARPDLCAVDNKIAPADYLAQPDRRPARFYVDSLTHDADALRMLVRLFSANRVALGSDYPFPLGEDHPGKLVESMHDLTDVQRRRILAETALEFLARGDLRRPLAAGA
ncbi:Amidohydrolase [Phycisphaerae bacterium RAS1]|nr:Amidohydrolase [Phycisphaerae bacterium RAS1]